MLTSAYNLPPDEIPSIIHKRRVHLGICHLRDFLETSSIPSVNYYWFVQFLTDHALHAVWFFFSQNRFDVVGIAAQKLNINK